MAVNERFRLEHQLCVSLYDASRAMYGCYRPLLAEIGLTYSQYAVMLALWEHERTTLRELGEMLHLDSGTLSPLLKRLERQGLIARSRHAGDERVLQVVITDAGRALQQRAEAVQHEVEAMTALEPAALAALHDELIELADRLRRAEADQGGDEAGSAA